MHSAGANRLLASGVSLLLCVLAGVAEALRLQPGHHVATVQLPRFAGRRRLTWCIVDCGECGGGQPEYACPPGYECKDNWFATDECLPLGCNKYGCGPGQQCNSATTQCELAGCMRDGCDDGYECNSATASCEPTGCLAYGCDPGYICDQQTASCIAQGCVADGCNVGYKCDRDTTECEPQGCLADGCDPGFKCNPLTTTCEATGCLVTGCLAGNECDRATAICKPAPQAPPAVTAPSTASAPGLRCSNDDPSCEMWAGQGECAKNAAYMTLYCKLACKVPGCEVKPPATNPPSSVFPVTEAPAPAPADANAPPAEVAPSAAPLA